MLSVFAGKYILRKLDRCCVSFLRATSELKNNSNKFNAVALSKLFQDEIIGQALTLLGESVNSLIHKSFPKFIFAIIISVI